MKTMKILFILLQILMIPSFSQEFTINTDRPDQSDGVATVPKNKFQIENGVLVANETVINNFMLRYGIGNSTEVRLLVDAGKELNNSGLTPISLSLKQRFIEQKNWIPAIAFVGYVSFDKLASKDFQSSEIPYELKLAFENEINSQFSLGYNIGTSDEFKNLNLTMGLGFAPTDQFFTYAEYFSTLNKKENSHNFDFGVLYLINNVFQIDLAIGSSFHDFENQWFSTAGLSYLIL